MDTELVECAICGQDLEPGENCLRCGDSAPKQSRSYTLSQIRAGQAPKDPRLGKAAGPRIVTDIPGSSS